MVSCELSMIKRWLFDFSGWCGVRDSSKVTRITQVTREGEQGSIAKRWLRRTRRNVEGRIEFRGVGSAGGLMKNVASYVNECELQNTWTLHLWTHIAALEFVSSPYLSECRQEIISYLKLIDVSSWNIHLLKRCSWMSVLILDTSREEGITGIKVQLHLS